MRQFASKNRHVLVTGGSLLLLLLVVAANFMLNQRHFVAGYLDYDSAAEIMTAHTMAQHGEWILSNHWYYCYEIRILHNQLVLAPLARIFDNLLLVQSLGSMVLNLWLAACVTASFILIKKKVWQGFFAAALILTPYSTIVFFNIHAGMYYIFHIANIFLFFGLFTRLYMGGTGIKQWLLLAFIAMFSFVMGLSGIRYALMVILPLLLVVGLRALFGFDRAFRSASQFAPHRLLAWAKANPSLPYAALCTALYGAGLLVYQKVLLVVYPVAQVASKLSFNPTDKIFDGLHSNLGSVISELAPTYGHGIMNMQGILLFIRFAYMLVAFACVLYLFRNRKGYQGGERFFIEALCALFIVNIGILSLTVDMYYGSGGSSDRYVLLAVLPLMALPALLVQKRVVGIAKRTAVMLLAVLVMGINVVSIGYIVENAPHHTGTGAYNNTEISQAVDFLLEEGYTSGYSNFDYSNVVNVLSNAQLQCADMEIREDGFTFHNWSQSTDLRGILHNGETAFMLLDKGQYGNELYQSLVGSMPVLWQSDNFILLQVLDDSIILG